MQVSQRVGTKQNNPPLPVGMAGHRRFTVGVPGNDISAAAAGLQAIGFSAKAALGAGPRPVHLQSARQFHRLPHRCPQKTAIKREPPAVGLQSLGVGNNQRPPTPDELLQLSADFGVLVGDIRCHRYLKTIESRVVTGQGVGIYHLRPGL